MMTRIGKGPRREIRKGRNEIEGCNGRMREKEVEPTNS